MGATTSRGDQKLRVSALVQRVATGDRAAFTELYDEMALCASGWRAASCATGN